MFSKEMEELIKATLEDGVITDQEKAVLIKRAQKEGIDVDELDVYIQSLLQKRHRSEAENDAIDDRKSKIGIVQKCPQCGEPIQTGWAACPKCGFAFNIEQKSSIIEELQAQLNQIEKDVRGEDYLDRNMIKAPAKLTAISSLAISNNRADLLQLLAFAKPKAKKDGPKNGVSLSGAENLSYAYWTLFENCISMAQISFAEDPAFKQFFNFYEEEIARPKKGFFARLFGK
ncbi:MAG: zinc ribbon domain-containing protein [Clostridiales bacterium]|nr:zinc ribbon domain-containing protein [Clostridiales bacterium]